MHFLKNYLRFTIVTSLFVVCVIYIYTYTVRDRVEISVNGVAIIAENAPALPDLIENNEQGPHQKFINAESCLVCHKQEINIPGVGLSPKIPHKKKENCIECHTLP